jgi:hypothetical protein
MEFFKVLTDTNPSICLTVFPIQSEKDLFGGHERDGLNSMKSARFSVSDSKLFISLIVKEIAAEFTYLCPSEL